MNREQMIKSLLYALPVVIPVFMYFCFQFLTKRISLKLGYFLSFFLYWVLCFTIPTLTLSPGEIAYMFRPVLPTLWQFLLLLIPPLLAFIFGPFQVRIKQAQMPIIIVSLMLAIVNGLLEEYLWRGFYILNSSNDLFLGIILPTIGFTIWHFAPQSVVRSENSSIFILSVAFIGMLWGIAAFQQGNILGASISHIICDFSGIGGLWYFDRKSV